MRLSLILSLALSLAACGTTKALPAPDGQVFRLNPERWGETVNDVRSAEAGR